MPTDEQNNTTPEATPAPVAGTDQVAQVSQTTPASTPSASASTDLGSETPSGDTPAVGATTDLGSEDEAAAAAQAAEPPPYAKYHAPPEDGVYADPVLPDGAVANPELKAKFLPVVAELGLSQEGMQKLVDFKSEIDQEQIKVWSDHLGELRTQAKADPEIGGNKYDASIAAGKAAISKFGTPGLRSVLNHYGVGAHPEMIRFMARVGAAMGETPALNGEGSAPQGSTRPLHEVLYTNPNS